MTNQTIKIKSSDGVEMELALAAATHSEFIKNALSLEDDEDGDNMNEVIACERVDSETLKLVVTYLTYYKDTKMHTIPDPATEKIPETFEELVPQEWYRNFANGLGLAMVWNVRAAAHFMLIEPLTALMNVWISLELMGKSTEEVNRILRLPNVTPPSNGANAGTRVTARVATASVAEVDAPNVAGANA